MRQGTIAVGAVIAALSCAPPALAQGAPQFLSPCGFSHRAPDDPIVSPGVPGASHSHDFIGNASTAADSVPESLAAAPTTCRRTQDRAAYWVPTLLFDGHPVKPESTTFYYQGQGHVDRTAVRPFPFGLRVVAGDAASTEPQPLHVVHWSCDGRAPARSSPPTCARGEELHLQVRFPECWDGRNLDAPEHREHMAYRGSRGACPASHPVPVPRLLLNMRWAIRGGPRVSLDSGPATTAHGDFFNAWDPGELERLVRQCINAGGDDLPACKPSGPMPPALEASAESLLHGERLELTGRTPGYPERPVRLELGGARGWQPLADLVSGRRAMFEHAFAPDHSGRVRAVDPEGRASATLPFAVTPRVEMVARRVRRPRGERRRGKFVRILARSSPVKRRLVIRVDRLLRDGRWRTARTVPADPADDGAARVTIRLVRRGRYRLVAVSPADAENAAAESAPVPVSVR